jgi:hypothetical protein
MLAGVSLNINTDYLNPAPLHVSSHTSHRNGG